MRKEDKRQNRNSFDLFNQHQLSWLKPVARINDIACSEDMNCEDLMKAIISKITSI